jgi:hypothetical protein
MADDLDFRIAKLEVKPGDVLVVKIATRITDQIAHDLKLRFEARLPDAVKVLVLDSGIDLSVLSFEEIERRAKLSEAA